MAKFLVQLYREHRMINAVLHGMRSLIDAHASRGSKLDPKVLRAMLYYLDVFPEREHHRKEEDFLFETLRRRSHEAASVLEQLSKEHEDGELCIKALEQCLLRFEEGGEREFEALARDARRFIDGYWDHMRREETEVMPLAERLFERRDWIDIEIALALNKDPKRDLDPDAYQALFSRIVNVAPPPIGVGPG